MESRGFIVAAWEDRRPSITSSRAEGSGARVLITGRLEDGRSFAAVISAARPALYVAPADGPVALEALRGASLDSATGRASGARAEDLEREPIHLDSAPWSDLTGAPLARLVLPHGSSERAARTLDAAGIRLLAQERPRAADTLSALGISGPVSIRGAAQPGRRVAAVFVDPELAPCRASTALCWMALDIETDRGGGVVAVSLAGAGGPGEVLFLGPVLSAPFITSFTSEAALLQELARRIVARDPDVITGWNVLDFDFDVLLKRFAAHSIPFDAGRTGEVVARAGAQKALRVPGRAVLDAMRLVRASGERFEELSLEAVSRSVLGEGKSMAARGLAKLAELERLRFEEPEAFCTYCLRDSELVLRILAKTGLDALTAKRCALTGVPLELAWTSIPAFERIYGAGLRARSVLPPEREERRVSGASGGTVLEAFPGIFSNVLVFDFRSLYPSLIRTVNIDPLSHARAGARAAIADDIVAPNGARFERAPGILPGIISRYAAEREDALAAGDETAAYVYKILQNSFYGVLGSDGCRYARTELAGAITSFGKKFLTAARDFFEQRGLRVLYGDTDSVFVLSGLGDDQDHAALTAFGAGCAAQLNARIAAAIELDYRLPSHLRIRCEKAYRRFFIPRIRSDSSGAGRGRAKGYAGLRLGEAGASELEVKGMEAARSDFTPLARRFQLELLTLAFAGAGEESLRSYCRNIAARLRSSELDAELVYRKSLRRSAEEYDVETPQVRAARQLGWTGRRGRISYVMTGAGAEALEARTGAPLDYRHYIEHQLLPIACSVAEALAFDGRGWLEEPAQLQLSLG